MADTVTFIDLTMADEVTPRWPTWGTYERAPGGHRVPWVAILKCEQEGGGHSWLDDVTGGSHLKPGDVTGGEHLGLSDVSSRGHLEFCDITTTESITSQTAVILKSATSAVAILAVTLPVAILTPMDITRGRHLDLDVTESPAAILLLAAILILSRH